MNLGDNVNKIVYSTNKINMNYEKAYKEALERARQSLTHPDVPGFMRVDVIFPELKESEDERIREDIIRVFKGELNYTFEEDNNKYIAWLEKQGKKVEPIEGFNTEFERQISHFIASVINKEHEYNEGYVKWVSNALLNYAKHDFFEQDEQKQDPCEHCNNIKLNCTNFPCIKKIAFEQGKPIYDVINEEKVNNANKTEQKYTWSEEDNLYYDDICEILINLLYSENPNVNKSAIQKDLDWFVTFVKQTRK